MTELAKTLSATRGAGLMLNIVVGAGLLALPGLVVEAVGKHALWAWATCAIAAIPLLSVFIIMGRKSFKINNWTQGLVLEKAREQSFF